MGDYAPLRRNYLVSYFLHDARYESLVRSVHLQCGADDANPVAETRWLQSLADDPAGRGFPHAIVAYADFEAPDVEGVLAGHCESANMRGIRYI